MYLFLFLFLFLDFAPCSGSGSRCHVRWTRPRDTTHCNWSAGDKNTRLSALRLSHLSGDLPASWRPQSIRGATAAFSVFLTRRGSAHGCSRTRVLRCWQYACFLSARACFHKNEGALSSWCTGRSVGVLSLLSFLRNESCRNTQWWWITEELICWKLRQLSDSRGVRVLEGSWE